MNEDNNKKLHRFTATIADVEPFVFPITLEEEPIFRKAAYSVNELWKKWQKDQPGKSSHYVLAKVALAFAELFYRNDELLHKQSKMLEDFEAQLDDILMSTD